MSKKGGQLKTKALTAPKAVRIKRKENVWTVRTQPGAHKRVDSVALGVLLRDIAKLAESISEVKRILNNGEVKVNGVIRKDYRFSVGLFDVVEIEKQKLCFRVLFDTKRRIIIKEMKKPSKEKLCKVSYKRMTKKGVMLTTNDGKIFMNDKANVGDTLKISFPENKIVEIIGMKKDALIYITKGVHCSEKGKIVEIVSGSARRKKLVKINQNGTEFETIKANVFVIGEKGEALEELK